MLLKLTAPYFHTNFIGVSTREQSNNNNIYDIGWRLSHGENGGVGKKRTKNYWSLFYTVFLIRHWKIFKISEKGTHTKKKE